MKRRHLKGRNLALICGESPRFDDNFEVVLDVVLRPWMFFFIFFSKLPFISWYFLTAFFYLRVNNRYSEVIVFSLSLSFFLVFVSAVSVVKL